jgi:hypothetical protein
MHGFRADSLVDYDSWTSLRRCYAPGKGGEASVLALALRRLAAHKFQDAVGGMKDAAWDMLKTD